MKVEPAVDHLIQRRLSVPALPDDAVDGAHGSGSIRAFAAMDERGQVGGVGDGIEELPHFVVGGIVERAKPDMHEPEIPAAGQVAVILLTAERNDRLHTELAELVQAFRCRLGAAIEVITDAVAVGQARQVQGRRPGSAAGGMHRLVPRRVAVERPDAVVNHQICRRSDQQHDQQRS